MLFYSTNIETSFYSQFEFSLKVTGKTNRTLTGLPLCIPGENVIFLSASIAASSQPPPIPRKTLISIGFPFSFTSTALITLILDLFISNQDPGFG